MREAVIISLLMVFLVIGRPSYLLDPSVPTAVKALTYHVFHANIFHFAGNALSIWVLCRPRTGLAKEIAAAFIIASLAYLIALRPVIGVSNIMFALIGLRTPALSDKWWRSKGAAIFLSVTLLTLAIPRLSAVTHIASFVMGVSVAMAARKYRSICDDCRRASR